MFKIGADPEFFLRNKETGAHISAHGIVMGNKLNPYPLQCGACQVDGTAVEFNIDPTETPEEFVHNIHTVLKQIRRMVPPKLEFDFSPCIEYNPVYFKALPKISVELGCVPDWNCYTRTLNPQPKDVGTMRTGAGHLHVGWTDGEDVEDEVHMDNCVLLAQKLDAVLYPAARHWDKDIKREFMYGNRGAFRPKHYGVEYRTPSNAWLRHPKLWPWLFDRTMQIARMVADGVDPESHREMFVAPHKELLENG